MAAQTAFASFGPDIAFAGLPPSFQACLSANPPGGCDATVGSLAAASGWCSQPAYARTTYCACVNNSSSCPAVAAAACANSAVAYQTQAMKGPAGREFLACRGRVLCNNVVVANGAQNTTSVVQNCGAASGPQVANLVKSKPHLAAIFLVLLFVLLLVVLAGADDDPPAFGAAGPPAFSAAAPAGV